MKMISLRLNEQELEALAAAAKTDKLKLTTWIKQAAMKAADHAKTPQLPETHPQPLPITPSPLR